MSTPTTRPDGTDLVGGDERVEPGAGTDVDDPLAGLQVTQRERVGDPGERLDRPIRQPVDDVGVVAESGGERPTGVEVDSDPLVARRPRGTSHAPANAATRRPARRR